MVAKKLSKRLLEKDILETFYKELSESWAFYFFKTTLSHFNFRGSNC